MSILDIIILVILVIAAVRGFRRGLVVEVLGIASIFIAGYAAYYLYTPISQWIKWNFTYKEELFFVIIFVAFMFGVGYIARLISNFFDTIGIAVADKIGGGIIAVLKYIIIMCIALAIFMSINDKLEIVSRKQMNETMLYKPMTKITDYLFPYFKKAKEEIIELKKEYFSE